MEHKAVAEHVADRSNYGGTQDMPSNDGAPAPAPMKMTHQEISNERSMIRRNVLLLCLALFLLLTSFNAMAILESTINSVGGSTSLAAVYVTSLLMSLFFSAWIIKELTVKWAIFFGMWGYIIYLLGQFNPSTDTLILSGVILGAGSSPMWIAYNTYMSQAGQRLAFLADAPNADVKLGQIFSLLHAFGHSSYLSGSLISSSVLSTSHHAVEPTDAQLSHCGINFCPVSTPTSADFSSLAPSDTSQLTLLIGILCGLAVLATYIIGCFVDPLIRGRVAAHTPLYRPQIGAKKRSGVLRRVSDMFRSVLFMFTQAPSHVRRKSDGTEDSSNGSTGFSSIKKLFSLFTNPRLFLLIIFCVFAGMGHSYMVADFTAAYIACRHGVQMIGYRIMFFAASSTLGCLLLMGMVAGMKGKRIPLIFGAVFLNVLSIILMISWSFYPREGEALLYIIPILWGFADSVWQTQLKAMLGSLFPDANEEAYSVLGLLEGGGFALNYILQPFICNLTKLILIVCMLTSGSICYGILEHKLQREKNTLKDDSIPITSDISDLR